MLAMLLIVLTFVVKIVLFMIVWTVVCFPLMVMIGRFLRYAREQQESNEQQYTNRAV